MFNSNKQTYLIIFSILYVLGMVVSGLTGNMFFNTCFNGMFTVGSIWMVYFLTNKKSEVTPPKETEKEHEDETHVLTPNKQPVKEDVIHFGIEISEDELEHILDDDKSWYKQSHNRINQSISDLKKIIDGEE